MIDHGSLTPAMIDPTPKRRPWLAALRQPSVWTRASVVGLPVGCLQALVNQGDLWWQHHADAVVVAKTLVSPLITFSVALISAAGTWVDKQFADNS